MRTSIISLSVQQLRRAADIKEKLETLEKELAQILGSPTKPVTQAVSKLKRKLSPEVRAKMAAAAKKRWAKAKGGQSSLKPVKRAKRKMSAAGRARIAAAAKARWAKAKAAGRNRL